MPAVNSGDGPVVVTGASGYIGAHVVNQLLKHGYDVRGCVTDRSNSDKTDFLLELNDEHPGNLTLHQANLLKNGSYDTIIADCSSVLHVGTPMPYGGAYTFQEVYDGIIQGINNIVGSIKKAGTVKRLVYTSSFAAVFHPASPGYRFTEDDWGSDNREDNADWNTENLNDKGDLGYTLGKIEGEHLINRLAEEDGRFDAVSCCPIAVVGPLLSVVHECVGSFQWAVGRALEGRNIPRGWQALWNITDVRDVAEAQVLMMESKKPKNGSRYLLCAKDESGEITAKQLQEHLQALFPHIKVGAPPPEYDVMIEKHGKPNDVPRARCDKARNELGLQTHTVEETLRDTGDTLVDLELIEPALK
jgi:nucleoside-diphosphate-sugar epimerase